MGCRTGQGLRRRFTTTSKDIMVALTIESTNLKLQQSTSQIKCAVRRIARRALHKRSWVFVSDAPNDSFDSFDTPHEVVRQRSFLL
jgi:cell division protein FtsL